jgi:hypothetical protein
MYNFLSEKSLRLAKFYGVGGTLILAMWIFLLREHFSLHSKIEFNIRINPVF